MELLAEGFDFGEGPRWYEGRLWLSDFYARTVWSVDADGARRAELELDDQPSGLGWLPTGELLVVAMLSRQVRRVDARGAVHRHADLAGIAGGPCNDMVVDGRGNAYVGNFGFDMEAGERPRAADLALVRPDGSVEVAATDLRFPNGSVVTPDGSTLVVGESMGARYTAFTIGEDGTGGAGCFRVAEGGEVLDHVVASQPVFACMLGGPAGTTLHLVTAPGFGDEVARGKGLGRVEVVEVDVPGAGWP